MKLDEKLDTRFQELLKEGESIMEKHMDGERRWQSWPSDEVVIEWYTSAKNLIEKVCGKDSAYYNQIEDLYNNRNRRLGLHSIFLSCMGVLRASYKDWKLGLLEDTKSLIRAEVFSNFIEQAEYLLKEGYKVAAAVLVRGVLEDGLRTLCKKNGITLPKKPQLEWMNTELRKKEVYNENVRKQITAWAGIGNSAAHGKTDEFTHSDVKNMINGVISFNATYLR